MGGEADESQSVRLLEKSERGIRGPYHQPGQNEQPTKNRLGTFFGVYIPTVLGIFGVVIFLRLSWITGQAGIFVSHSLAVYFGSHCIVGIINAYLMYLIAGSVAGLTGTSFPFN